MPGQGNLYVVRIEAVADPTPPEVSKDDLEVDLDRQIRELIKTTRGMSERELMDQVYRHLTIHLCDTCYRQWIEDPTG